jgi:erythromycin esterase-like protein
MWRNTEVRHFFSWSRQHIGTAVIGFGTCSGMVAAASEWDGPMEIKQVRPAVPGSHEQLYHASGLARFRPGLRGGDLCGPHGLGKERLERAFGVIYRPDTEMASHYFRASLPQQFDEYVWFDETHGVTALDTAEIKGLPDTYPIGL